MEPLKEVALEHKNPADAADRIAEARLTQRRALVKALTVTGPVVVALSLSKPAWAQTVSIP